MLPRPRGRRAARFCFIGARFSKCSGCISGPNQMGRFLDHHRRNGVHLIRYRRIFKTPLPGKCRFMRRPAPFPGGIAAGTTQIQGPLAVGARVSGRPPSLPGPVRRSGLEPFCRTDPMQIVAKERSDGTPRLRGAPQPGCRGPRNPAPGYASTTLVGNPVDMSAGTAATHGTHTLSIPLHNICALSLCPYFHYDSNRQPN